MINSIEQHFAKYEVHFSGALKDGHTMMIDDVVKDLNRKSFLESETIKMQARIDELEKRVVQLTRSRKQFGELSLEAHDLTQQAKGVLWVIDCNELNLSEGEFHTIRDKYKQLLNQASKEL
jgi:hypothetical protein